MVARSGIQLLTSRRLTREVGEVLLRPKLTRMISDARDTPQSLMHAYLRFTEFVHVSSVVYGVARDPDDDHVLALAVAGRADLLVSGDHDLLVVGAFLGVRIVGPAEALAMIEESKT